MCYGKYLTHHRLASGYKTQKDLATAAGVSGATISRIESEKQRPEPDTLKLLAKYLHTTTYLELLEVCGYTDTDILLSGGENKNLATDATSSEARFMRSLELSDEELLSKFTLKLDGRALTAEEARAVIAYLRTHRQMDK